MNHRPNIRAKHHPPLSPYSTRSSSSSSPSSYTSSALSNSPYTSWKEQFRLKCLQRARENRSLVTHQKRNNTSYHSQEMKHSTSPECFQLKQEDGVECSVQFTSSSPSFRSIDVNQVRLFQDDMSLRNSKNTVFDSTSFKPDSLTNYLPQEQDNVETSTANIMTCSNSHSRRIAQHLIEEEFVSQGVMIHSPFQNHTNLPMVSPLKYTNEDKGCTGRRNSFFSPACDTLNSYDNNNHSYTEDELYQLLQEVEDELERDEQIEKQQMENELSFIEQENQMAHDYLLQQIEDYYFEDGNNGWKGDTLDESIYHDHNDHTNDMME